MVYNICYWYCVVFVFYLLYPTFCFNSTLSSYYISPVQLHLLLLFFIQIHIGKYNFFFIATLKWSLSKINSLSEPIKADVYRIDRNVFYFFVKTCFVGSNNNPANSKSTNMNRNVQKKCCNLQLLHVFDSEDKQKQRLLWDQRAAS